MLDIGSQFSMIKIVVCYRLVAKRRLSSRAPIEGSETSPERKGNKGLFNLDKGGGKMFFFCSNITKSFCVQSSQCLKSAQKSLGIFYWNPYNFPLYFPINFLQLGHECSTSSKSDMQQGMQAQQTSLKMSKRNTPYTSYEKKHFCFLPKSAECQPNQPGQGWRFGLDRGLDVHLAMRTNHVLCPRLKIRTHHLYYLNDLLRLAWLNGSHGWHRLNWRWCFLVGWWRLLVHMCILNSRWILGRWLSKST